MCMKQPGRIQDRVEQYHQLSVSSHFAFYQILIAQLIWLALCPKTREVLSRKSRFRDLRARAMTPSFDVLNIVARILLKVTMYLLETRDALALITIIT
jgi:hypothetical protein